MIDAELLNGYVSYLERRFHRLEAKELNDPDPRRARQMDKYMTEVEAVLDLCDQIESETA